MKKLYMDLKSVLNTLICMIVSMLPGKKMDVSVSGYSNSTVSIGNGIIHDNLSVSRKRRISDRSIDYEKLYRNKIECLFDKQRRMNTIRLKLENRFYNQLLCPERAPCREQDRCLFSVHNIVCFDIE